MTTVRKLIAEYAAMAGIWVGLIVVFSLTSEHFLNQHTVPLIANRIPPLTLIAVGMTFVLIIGGIDLSVGSVMGLGGALLGVTLVDWNWSLPMAISLAILAGAAVGLVNGGVSAGIGIPSFIVSLGMLEIARGLAYMATDSQTKFIGAKIDHLGNPIAGLGLPPAFIMAIFTVIAGQVLLRCTAFGRRVLAIGANENAAHLAGIRTRSHKIIVFTMAGALAGLAAVCYTARLPSADPNAGSGLELSAIAAVVIGGTSLMGGRGSVVNSFFGVLIIATLDHGLNHTGASETSKRVITGMVIIVAVIVDSIRERWTNSRARHETNS
ncbi:MAG: ABC transporter permease [Limisphaerales bacterium]